MKVWDLIESTIEAEFNLLSDKDQKAVAKKTNDSFDGIRATKNQVLSSLVSRSDRSSKIRVLIAEDTYLQLALLGYILTHEISTERLD
jgi:hypothetical protein